MKFRVVVRIDGALRCGACGGVVRSVVVAHCGGIEAAVGHENSSHPFKVETDGGVEYLNLDTTTSIYVERVLHSVYCENCNLGYKPGKDVMEIDYGNKT